MFVLTRAEARGVALDIAVEAPRALDARNDSATLMHWRLQDKDSRYP